MKNPTGKTQAQLDLIRECINQVTQHPETHDQSSWHSECGSKHCIAGHCQLKMGKPKDSNLAKKDAQEGMGLTEDEAGYFFSGGRTRSELFGFASYLLNGEVWFDRDGFDRAGRDRDGRDREGRGREGRDRDGRDRDGFDRAGRDRDGRDRDGRDRAGRDRDGNLLPLL